MLWREVHRTKERPRGISLPLLQQADLPEGIAARASGQAVERARPCERGQHVDAERHAVVQIEDILKRTIEPRMDDSSGIFLFQIANRCQRLADGEPAAGSFDIKPHARPVDARQQNLDAVPPRFLLDRKSTRLNSSHVAISYAVFCLKKK